MKPHKQPSKRQLQMGEDVRHALAALLQRGEVRDPLLEKSVISVSEVQMSPDLKLATCYIAPLDSADPHAPAKEAVAEALNRHAKYIRGQMAHNLRHLRVQPEFRFRPDTSFDNFAKIDALLHSPEVARDLRPDADKADSGEDE